MPDKIPHAPGNGATYLCDDGRTVEAVYTNASTAVITLAGKTHRLHAAISADGARYVGDHWQWWTRGMRDARLAALRPGETIATSQGTRCHTP